MSNEARRDSPLVARVAALHAKAKAEGKVRPPEPPRERLPLDLPDYAQRAAGEHRAA